MVLLRPLDGFLFDQHVFLLTGASPKQTAVVGTA